LVGFLNLGLSAFDNKKAFRDNLIALTTIHVKRGIKAPSYGPFGEALFWTLRFCLGEQIYDEQAHRAWVILYSMMIRIMVGKTVELELKAKNASKKSDVTDKHEEVPHHFETYSYKASFIDPVYERA
jgi:hemoglobin-like flavoprotein